MRKIGYARVSSTDPNLDRQIAALRAEGCDEIYQNFRDQNFQTHNVHMQGSNFKSATSRSAPHPSRSGTRP